MESESTADEFASDEEMVKTLAKKCNELSDKVRELLHSNEYMVVVSVLGRISGHILGSQSGEHQSYFKEQFDECFALGQSEAAMHIGLTSREAAALVPSTTTHQ